MLFRFLTVLFAAAGLFVGGCAALQPLPVEPASPGARSSAHAPLRALPPPQEPLVAAVYRFRDQTGQYRMQENYSTFSTVVTQGATTILIKALEDSGWFTPIEREGLSNLLNERQIIQTTRAQFASPDNPQPSLPPLLFAGILLEGGIIGYDTNISSGGVGARYFGSGAAAQYRQDQVTVYLRAVATQSGEVLKTVHTTKTVLSQKLDGGVFRFVALNRLLEAESGFSSNEPPVLAVTAAIEEAVRNLIVEGVRDGLWAPASPGSFSETLRDYDQEVARVEARDAYGFTLPAQTNETSFGASAGTSIYQGDYQNPLARPAVAVHVSQPITSLFSAAITGGGGEIAADRAFRTAFVSADAELRLTPLAGRTVSPYLGGGLGALSLLSAPRPGATTFFPYASASAGADFILTGPLSLSVGGSWLYPFLDGLDGVRAGRANDSVFTVRTGLIYRTRF